MSSKTISLQDADGSWTISLAELDHLRATVPELQNKGDGNSTFFGWDDNGGPGVWVLENVSDEANQKLAELPPGIDQKTINKNLETVGAVWYAHWNMNEASRRARTNNDDIKDEHEQQSPHQRFSTAKL